MLPIKRLYTFIYQTFLPVFAMTFGICLFIFIIQFLWQHIEKLVGKGLETTVLLELFLYAALNLVPMVLPLSILLASLMAFGNMGERLELLAIKASGVSLLKIMRPMMVLITVIAIGCFFFQNKLAPKFRVKVASLFYAIKQKSPELDIPEGSFYNDLSGYSIYVKEKDLKTHMLRGVIIYDTSSGGFKNMSVDVCDSALMKVGDSEDYMSITMYNGERFANLKDEPGRSSTSKGKSNEFVPFMRENFEVKEIIIPFKNDFVRIDESRYDDTQISKNLNQLRASVDSMNVTLDSLNILDRRTITSQAFVNYRNDKPKDIDESARVDSGAVVLPHYAALNLDSVLNSYPQSVRADILKMASSDARGSSGSHLMYYHIDTPKPMLQRNIRLHEIFWHRMFTLPFACLVFFFIGAPLGSIIRKGGLGLPAVISVQLFIFYYIIDNIGYKMARDAVWEVWQGIWLSTGILFPLGVFLTYKSMNESALFNGEVYGKFLRKKLKINSDANRSITREPIPEEIWDLSALDADAVQVAAFKELDNNTLKDIVHNYSEYDYLPMAKYVALAILKERKTYLFDVRIPNFNFSYSKKVYDYYRDNSLYIVLPLYLLTVVSSLIFPKLAIVALLAFLVFYIKSEIYKDDFDKSVGLAQKGYKKILEHVLCLALFPIYIFYRLKAMWIWLKTVDKQPY